MTLGMDQLIAFGIGVGIGIEPLPVKVALYLRRLRESGEPIEVLLRDEPVAYLTPIGNRSTLQTPGKAAEFHELEAHSRTLV